MNETAMQSTFAPPAAPPKRRFGLRFSLRTLMLVMLLIAVYFGGRASLNWRYAFAPPVAGDWQANMPAGFVQLTTIQDLGDGQYLLSSRASVFSGKYEWRNGLL